MSFSVVILAAGKGTRMKSEKPKVLHTVGNASMLHHVMEVAKGAGAAETVIVAGHQAELNSQSANIKSPDAQIVIQEKQLGTGHAVKQAERLLGKSGKDILFDIDWQGTQQLMNSLQDDLVKIFVLPPSAKELEKRLLKRNQDTDETVKNRMSKASDEISHYAEYDYIIINEDFDESLKKINSILIAEGLKRTRQNKIQDVIKSLRDDLF